jgi:hypothetical protein
MRAGASTIWLPVSRRVDTRWRGTWVVISSLKSPRPSTSPLDGTITFLCWRPAGPRWSTSEVEPSAPRGRSADSIATNRVRRYGPWGRMPGPDQGSLQPQDRNAQPGRQQLARDLQTLLGGVAPAGPPGRLK